MGVGCSEKKLRDLRSGGEREDRLDLGVILLVHILQDYPEDVAIRTMLPLLLGVA